MSNSTLIDHCLLRRRRIGDRLLRVLAGALAVVLCLSSLAHAEDKSVLDAVRAVLADRARLPLTLEIRRQHLLGYYGRMDARPLWTSAERRKLLLSRMENAAYDGLNPADYPAEFLKRLTGEFATAEQKERALTELWFSTHFLKYAEDMKAGRLVPRLLYPRTYIPRKDVNGTGALVALNKVGGLPEFFKAWEPFTPLYRGLKIALARYLDNEASEQQVLDKSEEQEEGSAGPDVDALHVRLSLEGLLEQRAAGHVFDTETTRALRTLQIRYGVAETGRLDGPTIQALNIPLDRRIRQITLSMERQRWLPERLTGTTIVVNRGRGLAQIIVNGALVESYLAVPNCPGQSVFLAQETITSVLINPLWRVSPEYLTDILLPRLQVNPAAVENDGFELRRNGTIVPITSVPWKLLSRKDSSQIDPGVYFVQYPSPLNPLGSLQVPFGSSGRAFLFDLPRDPGPDGYCDPYLPETAFGLVNAHGITGQIAPPMLIPRSGIYRQIERGQTVTYPSRKGVEILVMFQSAWIEPGGSLRFGRDPYGEDRRLQSALDGKALP